MYRSKFDVDSLGHKDILVPHLDYIRSSFANIEPDEIDIIMECIRDLCWMVEKLSETYLNRSDDDNEKFLLTMLSLLSESNYSLPFSSDTKSKRVEIIEKFLIKYSIISKPDISRISRKTVKKLLLLTYTPLILKEGSVWSNLDLGTKISTVIKAFFDARLTDLYDKLPHLIPYNTNNDIDKNDLPRCPNPKIKICLKENIDNKRVVRFMCPCKKHFYCSVKCQQACVTEHYGYCSKILAAREASSAATSLLIPSKKPINEKASNVEPFITVCDTWINSLSDLWALGATCKLFKVNIHNHAYAKRIFYTNLLSLIKPFGFPSLDSFNQILIASNALLAGSLPLQAIIGESFGPDSDMDLYVTHNNDTTNGYYDSPIHLLLNALGWIVSKNSDNDDAYDYMDFLSFDNGVVSIVNSAMRDRVIEDVLTYNNSSYNRKIQVIVASKKSLQHNDLGSVVNHYDLSFLQNWYNGHKFRMNNPTDTILKVGHFNKKLLKKLKRGLSTIEIDYTGGLYPHIPSSDTHARLVSFNQKLLARVDKYNKRGFVTIGKQPPRDLKMKPKLW